MNLNIQRESLLNDEDETLLGGGSAISEVSADTAGSEESLIDNDFMTSPVLDIDINAIEGERRNEIISGRTKFFMNPVNQAEILYQNYMMSHPGIIMTGKQKRNLKREFLKNAKKGKYGKMFTNVIYGIPNEKSQKNFERLNG